MPSPFIYNCFQIPSYLLNSFLDLLDSLIFTLFKIKAPIRTNK